MHYLRRYRGLMAGLACLALLAQSLALSVCPHSLSSGHTQGYATAASLTSTFLGADLGWVPLCLTRFNKSAPDRPQVGGHVGGQGAGHGSYCAAMCAAVMASLASIAAYFFAILLLPLATAVFVTFPRQRLRRAVLYGGIGSRAPPVLV